jgi:hypothetical protein
MRRQQAAAHGFCWKEVTNGLRCPTPSVDHLLFSSVELLLLLLLQSCFRRTSSSA